MAEGRQEADWWQTASVQASIYEVNRDRKRRPRAFTAEDFLPPVFRRRPKKVLLPLDVEHLERVFVAGYKNMRLE